MQKFILIIAGVLVLAFLAIFFVSWRRPLAVAAYLHRRELAKAGLTKSQIKTDVGIQTVFSGGHGPTLIFLHGAGDQAGAWSKVVPNFTAKYRVIVPDLAGHGDSEPKNGPLSVSTILAGLEGVANSEQGKVIIVGNSLGAWVATLYAHQHPEKVERLVLVNGGAIKGDRPDLTLTPKNREEARKLLREIMDPGNAELPDYVVDDIVREAQTGPLMRLSQTANEMPKYLLDGRMNEIRTPVSVLWGESDKMMSLAYARRMTSQWIMGTFTTLPRCGHAPQLECPRAFSEKLIRDLAIPLPPPTGTLVPSKENNDFR